MDERHLTRYNGFIASRPLRVYSPKEGLCRHHIIPKCVGGRDAQDNLIVLTEREHYLAHLMLWKAYHTSSLAYAFLLLSNQKKVKCSRLYKSLKVDLKNKNKGKRRNAVEVQNIRAGFTAEVRQKMSELHKGQIAWNKNKTHSSETREKMSKANSKKVKNIETGEEFSSLSEAAKKYGISTSAAGNRIKEARKSFPRLEFMGAD